MPCKYYLNFVKLETVSFSFVFFLFQNEHVMIEKLLKFFVSIVDTKLFKRVKIKNFESGNIQNTDEKGTLGIITKSSVYDRNKPVKKTFETSLRKSSEGVDNLINSLALDDVIISDFYFWAAKCVGILTSFNTQ